MQTLVTILFWTLPALPIVVGYYGWRRGHKAGYDQACADYSIAKEQTERQADHLSATTHLTAG